MEKPLKLSVLIVSWNSRSVLTACLDSLHKALAPLDAETWLVDNASSDDTLAWVAEAHPWVQRIAHPTNAGFAAANNLGIERARGEYVLLLNPDTVLDDVTLLERWVAWMDAHEATAASGVQLVWPDGSHQVGDSGHRPELRSALGHFLGLSRLSPRLFPPLFLGAPGDAPRAVDWICGAGLMARREVLEEIGGLDESIFMFAEDIEWGCRASAAGFPVTYLPALRLTHLQGGSWRQREAEGFSTFWLGSLRAVYFRLNRSQPRWLYDGIVLLGFGLRLVARSLHRSPGQVPTSALRKYLGFSWRNFGRDPEAELP